MSDIPQGSSSRAGTAPDVPCRADHGHRAAEPRWTLYGPGPSNPVLENLEWLQQSRARRLTDWGAAELLPATVLDPTAGQRRAPKLARPPRKE